jgi:hypothetical protein
VELLVVAGGGSGGKASGSSGGGGGAVKNADGGNGGSGIVIVRYVAAGRVSDAKTNGAPTVGQSGRVVATGETVNGQYP